MFRSFPIDVINSLSSLELELLRYINSHKEETINSSIHALAKNTFVSTTSIIRLCKKLNLEGYSHLKYFIKETMKNQDALTKNTYPSHSIKDLLEEELEDIKRTGYGLDLEMIRSVAALMQQQSQIHFFAKGLTSIVFEYTTRHLLSLSRHVTLYNDTHVAYIKAENMSETDLLFLGSLSGETEQVIRMALIAKSKHAKIVTFTTSPTSQLAKIGDYHFLLVNDATTTLDVDTKSRCQLMLILNLIVKSFVQLTDKDRLIKKK